MAVVKVFLVAIAIGMVLAGPGTEKKKDPVPTHEEFEAFVKDCQKVYPIEDGEITDLRNHVIKEDADRLRKCYVHCIMDKTKMMGPDGKFDVDKIYDIVISKHKKELKEDPLNAIKECVAKSTQEHVCERAFASKKCVSEKKLW